MTTPGPSLSEFLLARIAEDETTAYATTPGPWKHSVHGHRPDGVDHSVWAETAGRYVVEDFAGNPYAEADAAHISRHDPAHVLARCEAHRRIVNMHADDGRRCSSCYIETHDINQPIWPQASPCPTLYALALPYSDHPDCRDEWRP
jgi:hypothetical protein